ncbi:MAG: nitronate monooxygenase [Planctomycetes bacterium]|nr:nitronate monooxygenase [Planctomycetota bacterium]NOG53480.1 nitronate monooxygenase [Planctomycetota bacterium]
MAEESLPRIIQGGMGAGVSSWRLARAVSKEGQLGVVSGTGLDALLARRLQMGDHGGHMRRALSRFPIPGVAQRILDRYFVAGGKADDAPFKSKPMLSEKPSQHATELMVAGNFAEVYLAREGHGGSVGINYLEKIQLPTLPSIYGAMLAGVTWVLMGAGIPRAIPGILDRLSVGEAVETRFDVAGAGSGESFSTHFDPKAFCGESEVAALPRPGFLAIISSATLGNMLIKRASGRVDGFVVEGPTAGGHNAPPRGQVKLTANGEPIYGDRDAADLGAIKKLGLPFWLAGGYADPDRLVEALAAGAAGIQVGTAFAYCEESDLAANIKAYVLAASREGRVHIRTDPVASPTGFPFKVLQKEGTCSEQAVYEQRRRICDLGYLRHAYKKKDGSVGWRCPAEPVDDYVRKGGDIADTVGRKCVCNGLMADIGLEQVQRDGARELPLITSGDEAVTVSRFLKPGQDSYSASDVLAYLLSSVEQPV